MTIGAPWYSFVGIGLAVFGFTLTGQDMRTLGWTVAVVGIVVALVGVVVRATHNHRFIKRAAREDDPAD